MKKIISTVLLCAMLLITLASCSSGFDYLGSDLTKYVTLGEYNGIAVTAKNIDEITDEAVQDVIDLLLDEHKTAKKITDRAVAVGDTIYLTYEGHLVNEDGSVSEEKFEGGTTTTAQSLLIGGGKMIDGFEDGLVGVIPADTSADAPFALNVTFPSEYSNNPDLAGKPAVFYCVVEYIVDDTIEAGEIMDDSVINVDLRATHANGTVERAEIGATFDLTIDVGEEEGLPEEVAEAIIGKELTGEPLVIDPVDIEFTVTDDNDNETKYTITYNVTVNYMEGTDYDMPELTDEFVAEHTDFDTVDAYTADVRATLEADREEQLEKNKINATWNAIVEASELVKTPSSAMKAARKDVENNLYATYYYYNFSVYYFYYYYYGSYYWTDFTDFLVDYFSDYENYEDGITAETERAVHEQLVFYSIVKELGYDKNDPITEEEYEARLAIYANYIVEAYEEAGYDGTLDEYLEENYADYYAEGIDTPEEIIVATYGGEETVRNSMLWDYVMEELAAKANITLK